MPDTRCRLPENVFHPSARVPLEEQVEVQSEPVPPPADEQRPRWLPWLDAGEVVASFALIEPGVGSDPAGPPLRLHESTGGIQRLVIGGGLVRAERESAA